MRNQDEFFKLYEIAKYINAQSSLHTVLKVALQKTASIFNIDTGWIWLTDPINNTVYLAASHHLPPALKDYPERLSGDCYCIKQYFSDDIDKATNISEISCSRLWNIDSGTQGLKFHATIPIVIDGRKVGLLNLLTKEHRELTKHELTILNMVSELIGSAILRSNLQDKSGASQNTNNNNLLNIIEKVLLPKLSAISNNLDVSNVNTTAGETVVEQIVSLQKELLEYLKIKQSPNSSKKEAHKITLPFTPLTQRELEVLRLIQKGLTNNQIGNQLFITERTVKFHISSILSKLNADNRIQALNIGVSRGLL